MRNLASRNPRGYCDAKDSSSETSFALKSDLPSLAGTEGVAPGALEEIKASHELAREEICTLVHHRDKDSERSKNMETTNEDIYFQLFANEFQKLKKQDHLLEWNLKAAHRRTAAALTLLDGKCAVIWRALMMHDWRNPRAPRCPLHLARRRGQAVPF